MVGGSQRRNLVGGDMGEFYELMIKIIMIIAIVVGVVLFAAGIFIGKFL